VDNFGRCSMGSVKRFSITIAVTRRIEEAISRDNRILLDGRSALAISYRGSSGLYSEVNPLGKTEIAVI